jgi:hypothetical protein
MFQKKHTAACSKRAQAFLQSPESAWQTTSTDWPNASLKSTARTSEKALIIRIEASARRPRESFDFGSLVFDSDDPDHGVLGRRRSPRPFAVPHKPAAELLAFAYAVAASHRPKHPHPIAGALRPLACTVPASRSVAGVGTRDQIQPVAENPCPPTNVAIPRDRCR